MSPEEWLASQPNQAAPAVPAPVATAAPAPTAQVAPSAQTARDREAIPILLKELEAAQVLKNAGDTRAAADVDAIVRELAAKGVKVDVAAMSAPAASAAPAAPAAAPLSPEEWAASQPKTGFMEGFFEGIAEQVTGNKRSASPEVAAALAEKRTIYDMPEANQMSFGLLKAALGGLMAGSEERAQIFAANFPGLTYRLDQQGTVFLRSPTDGKEYVIEPGLTMQDVPRVGATVAAFTPAGRALTIPGAAAGAGATQAVIEASQAATGGQFNAGEVGMAAATGPLGQVLQRVVPPAVQAVRRGIQGRAPAIPPAAARGAPPVEPTEPSFFREEPPAGAAIPEAPPPVPPAPPTTTTTVTTEIVNNLVQKASGTGFGSAAARDKLADLAQINVAAKEAADRLGIQLPADVFSDNPQVRAAAGLARGVTASEAEAAWRNTVTQAVDKADDVIKEFDAQFIEGAVAPGVVSQKIKDSLINEQKALVQQAKTLYDAVDLKVPEQTLVTFPALKAKLAEITLRLGAEGVEKNATLKMLNKMVSDADAGKVPYGRLKEEKTLIGDSIKGVQNDYSKSTSQGRLKEIYGALAKDQLDNVEKLADAEVRQQLRSANLLTAKEKALGKRIVNAFGEDIEGSLGSKLRSAIISGGKGDTGDFNRLFKIVPEEYRRETLATALAAATRSARGAEKGGFGFSEFADIYPKLRANPQVYKTIVDTLGKDSADVLRDLFEVSKRITEARANVSTTGKANQAFLNPEGLIGKVMDSTITQRIVTTVTGMVPGGGAVAPDILKFMSTGAEDRVKAAGKLFADEAFQNLAVEAASKVPSAASLRRAAMSQSFQKFADAAKLPKGLDARIQWLQSAIQTERQFDQEKK
jgi:hypothetical protein